MKKITANEAAAKALDDLHAGKRPYRTLIEHHAPNYDPRHVEAYMRLEHGTLDAMSLSQFEREVKVACRLIRIEGVENAELLAKSYGM